MSRVGGSGEPALFCAVMLAGPSVGTERELYAFAIDLYRDGHACADVPHVDMPWLPHRCRTVPAADGATNSN